MKQSDFYSAESIQPFRRDLSDRKRYFEQRDSLLRHLGIVPRLLNGASILELGPGHGENALFLLQQRPKRLVLVEVNNECAAAAESLLSERCPEESSVECHHLGVDEFETDERFDLVVFEGVIPFEPEPEALLERSASFVAPGGLLSVTCIDSVSLFSEALRRLIGLIAAPPTLTTPDRVGRLLPIFSPHLATLDGMTRAHEDWILDQMIHPWSGRALSILDAARTLAPNFDLFGTSPAFLTDWRWFRNVHGERGYLELAERAYFSNLHNLVDYRFARSENDLQENRHLLRLCDGVLQAVRSFEANADPAPLKRIMRDVSTVAAFLEPIGTETRAALEDYLDALRIWADGGKTNDFGRFTELFGRGQQYASFLRRPAEMELAA